MKNLINKLKKGSKNVSKKVILPLAIAGTFCFPNQKVYSQSPETVRKIEKIENFVKENPSYKFLRNTDTVYVFEDDSKKIEVGSDYVDFKTKGESQFSYYDINSDGYAERIIVNKGKLKDNERLSQDLTGLAGCKGLDLELQFSNDDFFNSVKENFKPSESYANRKVFCFSKGNSGDYFDFEEGKSYSVGEEMIEKIQDKYAGVVNEAYGKLSE